MPTNNGKQYKSVAAVARAAEKYGAQIRPEIIENEPDWRRERGSKRYSLKLMVDGENVIQNKVTGVSIAIINQSMQALLSTIESHSVRTRKPRKGEYANPQPLRVVV